MTSTFALSTASSRAIMHASAAVCTLVVGTPMQGIVVLPPRSPGPGRP